MRGNLKVRLLIGVAIVAFAFFKKCNQQEENPYTNRVQTINMTSEQEIAIGLTKRTSNGTTTWRTTSR